ncbi:MAG: cyclic nucleotide-binding domain-containing protein [Cytophagales bacterium]|nr:MAG: cyclic nucleotide-binding domain-containing protein [Cytophagales bacterium]TAF62535.1 MAG: cyclic nucleotide-binding domain-containing protein [Cytophagales bacterium]
MRLSPVIKALKQTALFQGLEENALKAIALKAKTRQFFAEDLIVHQGDPSNALYIITNGIVAVKRRGASNQDHVLAYLMPGNSFGEVGILENQTRSASVTALSDVDLIVIRREDFLDILHDFPQVAIELCKTLGRYLVESNRRVARGNKKSRLILIFDTFGSLGATTLGLALAQKLYAQHQQPTVYTEYPNSQQLLLDMAFDRKTKLFKHPKGHDVLVSQDDADIQLNARTTILLDKLLNDYENVVITLNEHVSEKNRYVDENIASMLDFANQIILLTPPSKDIWKDIEIAQKQLRKYIRPYETTTFTVVNRSKIEYKDIKIDFAYDLELPFLEELPKLPNFKESEVAVPKPFLDIVDILTDRLERTHQISVFIPTTIDVDQIIDTAMIVERTLKFLAQRFGGATSKQAQGVWNSDEMGLVGETVFIVNTFVTQADLNKYLDEVVEYIKGLKEELRQEAMAMEVDQKLTLI